MSVCHQVLKNYTEAFRGKAFTLQVKLILFPCLQVFILWEKSHQTKKSLCCFVG